MFKDSKIKKELKDMYDQKKFNIDHKGSYEFSLSDRAITKKRRGYLLLSFVVTIVILVLSDIYFNGIFGSDSILILILIAIFLVENILVIYSYIKLKKSKCCYFKYVNGDIEYFSEIGKRHSFNVRDIDRIDFALQGRYSRMILYISYNSTKYIRFRFDILMFSEVKDIFALLLGEQYSTHVLF